MTGLMRRFALFLLAVLAAGVLAGAAPAARPPLGDHQLTTAHFMVHYNTDVGTDGAPGTDYATQTQAGDIASDAEQAYATYRSWGFSAPPADADGLIDIYVVDLSGPPAEESLAGWDTAGPAGSTGYFELATPTQLAGFATKDGMTTDEQVQQTVAANVFYMFEFGSWAPTTSSDYWLFYGPGTWASFASMTFPPSLAVGNPDIALDCSDSLPAHQMCDPDFYNDGGFARWTFFSLLASKYGNSFLNSVLANGAAGETGTTALSNALAAKGTTLASVYTDYVNRFMSGTLGPTLLTSFRPTAYASVTAGIQAVTTTTTAAVVPLNHLSARFVAFQRGDGDGSHACYAATLTVNVTMPSGTSSQPSFFWDATGSSAQPLSVNGNTASITVPWDTCDWGPVRGWLSLPNASTSVDGAAFTVSYSMTVDTTTPATASPPPDPVSIWGSTVPVPTADVAPTIDVFGPELLKVSPKSRVIRLIVDSSGVGGVNAALGSVALGSRALRAGNNDLRFTVPAKMLGALRRTSSSASVLTLTPVSPAGTAGLAVTRHVAVTGAKPVKKQTVKKKAKKKK
jgi:hypothetical protein